MDIEIFAKNNYLGKVAYNYPFQGIQNQKINICLWSKVRNWIRCYVVYINGNFSFCTYPSSATQKIIILLESPHKDEFDTNFNPLIPLNGISGQNFDQKILGQLSKWFQNIPIQDKEIFEIMLYNPVPFQTSLYHFLSNKIPYQPLVGAPTNITQITFDRTLRNNVWKLLYKLPCCEQYMIDFLKNYKPNYIINCCTGSQALNTKIFRTNFKSKKFKKTNNLKAIVRNSLLNTVLQSKNIFYMEDYHPLSWK